MAQVFIGIPRGNYREQRSASQAIGERLSWIKTQHLDTPLFFSLNLGMMSPFITLAARRQSVRAYAPTPVEREKLQICLEAVRLAPSACNAQPWKIIIIDEPQLKSRVAETTRSRGLPLNHFTAQAPILAVLVSEGGNTTSTLGSIIKGKDLPLIDMGIAAEHFCLAAADLGLGTCILGWFDERRIKALLGIPAGKRPIVIITLGYPADLFIKPKKRKDLAEISAWNGYAGKVPNHPD